MKGHQLASGQVVIGGLADNRKLSSVEIFPQPSSDTCSIPDLPTPRTGHSLSLLSGGRLVVCGGESAPESRSCIVWARGSTDWTHLHSLRSAYFFFRSNKELTQQCSEIWPCGLDTTIYSRLHHSAWGQGSRSHCRDCARFWEVVKFSLSLLQVEDTLHCATLEAGPAGFLMKTRLWWPEDGSIILSRGGCCLEIENQARSYIYDKKDEQSPSPSSRGGWYPFWFNSMFEFCGKMIQFNIWFNIAYRKFNLKNYSFQNDFWWFNSKDNSIQ